MGKYYPSEGGCLNLACNSGGHFPATVVATWNVDAPRLPNSIARTVESMRC